MRNRLRAQFPALLLVLAACADSTGPAAQELEAISGTYTLQTINEQALPFVLPQLGAIEVEIMAGAITLREDLSYSETMTFRTTEDGVETLEDALFVGTYIRLGTILSITSEGDVYTLSIGGDAITEQIPGLTFVWTR